jgi:hypothetical protein
MADPRIRLFIGERVFMVRPLEPLPELPARMGWLAVELGGKTFTGRLDEVDTWLNPEVMQKLALQVASGDD